MKLISKKNLFFWILGFGLIGIILWVWYVEMYPPISTIQQDQVPSPLDRTPLPALKSSTLVNTTIPFSAEEQRAVIVYLPVGYSAVRGVTPFPVLYLLHGSPGKETDWLTSGHAKETLDMVISNKTLPPSIVVMPDGNGGFLNDTQYINSTDGTQPNETFIANTLVHYIDQHYATQKQPRYRAIGGLSSGGFGALNIGLKHQDIFGNILCFSGYGKIEQNASSKRLIQGSEKTIENNSPIIYIKNLTSSTVKVWLTVGEQDQFLSENHQIATALQDRKISTTLQTFPGEHNWDLWSGHLQDGLRWLGLEWK